MIFVTVTTDTPLVEVTELVLLAELLELVLLVVELVLSSAATRAVASISTSMIQLKIPTIFFMILPFLLPDNPLLSEKADIRPGFSTETLPGRTAFLQLDIVSGQGNVTQKNASQAYYIRSIATV